MMRTFVAAVAVCVATLTVPGGLAHAETATPPVGHTIGAFETLLAKKAAEPDVQPARPGEKTEVAEAQESLAKFRALQPDQQAEVEEVLADGASFGELAWGTVDLPTGDGPSAKPVETVSSLNKHLTSGKYFDVYGNYVVEQRIWGILLTRFRQDFYWKTFWQGSYNTVPDTKMCRASWTNFNPSVSIGQETNHWVFGGHGICETTWHGSWVWHGTGISIDKIQHFEVDGRGYYSRWLRNN